MEFLNKIHYENQIVTYNKLNAAFKSIGIKEGDNLIVHCSLKKMGYVVGGVETIFLAVTGAVGNMGNVIVPSQSAELSHPESWQYPPLKDSLIKIVADNILGYDKNQTPVSPALGKFCEYFCMHSSTIRSNHPLYSFSVFGKDADSISKNHSLDFPFGINSPLYWLYLNGGKILMIGTDFDTNTSIHLAETLVCKEEIMEKAKIRNNCQDEWVCFKNALLNKYDDYLALEKAYCLDNKDTFLSYKLGDNEVRVFDLKLVVDYAIKYYSDK